MCFISWICFERSESKIFDFGVAEGHFEGPKDPNLIEKHTNYEFFARSPRNLTISGRTCKKLIVRMFLVILYTLTMK